VDRLDPRNAKEHICAVILSDDVSDDDNVDNGMEFH
jgi:hypothetical protein